MPPDPLPEPTMGAVCGHCGGSLYFATCPHEWAIASECQRTCGAVYPIESPCEECP